MIQTSARLLRLMSLLQSRRHWTGPDLAETLGVTERSVRRDVDRLRGLGYPVHATSGVGGGYRLGAGKELPPLPLEDDEAVALAIGLRAAATGPVKGAETASLRALVKLEQVLPARLRRRVNALQSVSVRLGDPGPAVDAETLTVLANACRDHEVVRFDYRSHDGAATMRSVEPYRLVHTSYRWYLLAFDLERGDWRTFRVDRVGPKPRPAHAFAPRPLPSEDVAAYVSRSVSTVAQQFHAHVTLHAPVRVVEKRMQWITGRLEPLDGDRCSLRLTAGSLTELAFRICFLDLEFELHEPEEVAEYMRQLSRRVARGAAGPRPVRRRARTGRRG
jgi:predicted DNA-binding transcriptional regulator YafY